MRQSPGRADYTTTVRPTSSAGQAAAAEGLTLSKEVVMVRTLLAGALVVVCAAALAAADDAKGDLDKMQGEWQMVSSVQNGKEVPPEVAEKIVRTIKGDKYTLTADGKEIAKGTFKIDPSKKPKTIDAKREGSDDAAPGIYELEGDTQKVCLSAPGKDRPSEFSSKEGSGHVLTVWKRKK
jgi:uncharacterized protein (TIGR03067 family)